MADPLSIVASVITIISAVNTARKMIQDIYHAPDELQQLGLELEYLRPILNEVERSQVGATAQYLRIHLDATNALVNRTQALLDTCVTDPKTFSHRQVIRKVKVFAWARLRKKTERLVGEVRKMKDLLVTDVNVLTLAQLNRLIMTSDTCSSTTAGLVRRVEAGQAIMQGSLTSTIRSLRNDQQIFLQHISHLHQETGLQNLPPARTRQLAQAATQLGLECKRGKDIAPDVIGTHSYSIITPLDRSSNSYPEAYTVDNPYGPRLFITSQSTEQFGHVRTEVFRIHYAVNARNWVWMTLCITGMNPDHKSINICPPGYTPRTVYVQSEARHELEELVISAHAGVSADEYHDDILLKLSVKSESDISVHGPLRIVSANLTPADELYKFGVELARLSRHLGCPQFSENDLAYRSRPHRETFIVNIRSKTFFYEVITINSIEKGERITTLVKMLHAERNSPLVVGLGGIVLDKSQRYAKGYLLKHPEGEVRTLWCERIEKPYYPWSRAQRWARYITEAVADVHRGGFTIGDIQERNLMLDDNDIPCFFLRSSQVWASDRSNGQGLLAPELREKLRLNGNEVTHEQSFESDLFELGTVLWLIGSPSTYELAGAFCRYSGCSFYPPWRCTAAHANPIVLPVCAHPEAPLWYQAIIASCRQLDPRLRKPARELLDLFPSKDDIDVQWKLGRSPEDGQDVSQLSSSDWKALCEQCVAPVQEGYICSLCNGQSSVVACFSCAQRGMHCDDLNQTLYWWERSGDGIVLTGKHPNIMRNAVALE